MDSKEQIHFLNPSLEEAFKYFYVVPEYQREYVWGDTEVEQLLSDIGEAFQTGKQKDYFIRQNTDNIFLFRQEFEKVWRIINSVSLYTGLRMPAGETVKAVSPTNFRRAVQGVQKEEKK